MKNFNAKYGDLLLAIFILINGGNLIAWAMVASVKVFAAVWLWLILLPALFGAVGGFIAFISAIVLIKDEVRGIWITKRQPIVKEKKDEQPQMPRQVDGEI